MFTFRIKWPSIVDIVEIIGDQNTGFNNNSTKIIIGNRYVDICAYYYWNNFLRNLEYFTNGHFNEFGQKIFSDIRLISLLPNAYSQFF